MCVRVYIYIYMYVYIYNINVVHMYLYIQRERESERERERRERERARERERVRDWGGVYNWSIMTYTYGNTNLHFFIPSLYSSRTPRYSNGLPMTVT